MYIDEVGNSGLGTSRNPDHRYLSLTGIIIRLDHVSDWLFPQLESLKQSYFDSHPDEPIILHRKDIVNHRGPFATLRDPRVEQAFGQDIISLIDQCEFTAMTVVIDKREHLERYQVWRFDPYHYSLTILLERYVRWLQEQRAVGDVMAESRGKREDLRLKGAFARLLQQGTSSVASTVFAKHLTSRELKVKPKQANVAGLQLADLLAYPSYRFVLDMRGIKPLTGFNSKIAALLEQGKYRRSPSGKIEGWGVKWLP
ncbi:MAG: DUF3800 domain-containing protein [Sphaerobacter sp.]|nr:DUF3800 domain-containing protein [Sphaerobacter sp.]